MKSQGKADFVNKLSISLKEATETKYWLELLYESDNLISTQFDSLINDLNIIIGTLVTTIKNTKRNGGNE
ncbi:MAG: four helix bundle protein [Bacteroidaceae bacterium]|nr:four helix bundle protein [Bacteroidaceae bacterium]